MFGFSKFREDNKIEGGKIPEGDVHPNFRWNYFFMSRSVPVSGTMHGSRKLLIFILLRWPHSFSKKDGKHQHGQWRCNCPGEAKNKKPF